MEPRENLAERGAAIVAHVAQFRQMTAAQLRRVLFHANASATPLDRALRRLTSLSYLMRIEHPRIGGARGGSGQYVYSLGRRGYYRFYDGKYSPARSINRHALGIAECYVALTELHRADVLALHNFQTEPDCWRSVGPYELRPDGFIDIELRGKRLLLWLEADMATEGGKQIKAKLELYWNAYREADAADWPQGWPVVVWAAIDDERAKEIAAWLRDGPEAAQALFRVCTIAGLPNLLRSW